MFAIFTDFGWRGPYVGQLKAVLAEAVPGRPAIDLLHDAPLMDPRASAYLLEPFARALPESATVIGVVDPGVGTERPGCAVQADGRWYVGPANGLFEFVVRRADDWAAWELLTPAGSVAPTFHGRDVFAPAAAALAVGQRDWLGSRLAERPGADWPDDIARVLYIDDYGNAMTGIRATTLSDEAVLEVAERWIERGETFADQTPGEPLWYRNSSGLVEVAVNGDSAAACLALQPGSRVRLVQP
mgnify:CR=1 FL=1